MEITGVDGGSIQYEAWAPPDQHATIIEGESRDITKEEESEDSD